MKSIPRFLIAKYTPDLRRMEPRNIGVVLWSSGRVAARFVGENGGSEIHPPRYLGVASRHAYREWIYYWRNQIERPSIILPDGRQVDREDPDFVDALRDMSKRQYLLANGGIIKQPIPASELDFVVNDLFEELVEVPSKSSQSLTQSRNAQLLARACKDVMLHSGIANRKDYFPEYPVVCPVGQSKQSFTFDFALHTTRPRMIMSRVFLWKAQSVQSTAFKFQSMQHAFPELSRERCAALVYHDESVGSTKDEDDIRENVLLLKGIGSVINVANTIRAADELLDLVPH